MPFGKDLLNRVKKLEGYGHIIEKVSNANGTAIKFSDGTMICFFRKRVTDQPINVTYGSLYEGVREWNYPVNFISTPTVICSEFFWGTGASWGSVRLTRENSCQLIGYDAYPRPEGEVVQISAMAIGRWK